MGGVLAGFRAARCIGITYKRLVGVDEGVHGNLVVHELVNAVDGRLDVDGVLKRRLFVLQPLRWRIEGKK